MTFNIVSKVINDNGDWVPVYQCEKRDEALKKIGYYEWGFDSILEALEALDLSNLITDHYEVKEVK